MHTGDDRYRGMEGVVILRRRNSSVGFTANLCAGAFYCNRVLSLSQAMQYAEMPILSALSFQTCSSLFQFWFLSPSPSPSSGLKYWAVHSGLPRSPVFPSSIPCCSANFIVFVIVMVFVYQPTVFYCSFIFNLSVQSNCETSPSSQGLGEVIHKGNWKCLGMLHSVIKLQAMLQTTDSDDRNAPALLH
jgi:hypothetical protein